MTHSRQQRYAADRPGHHRQRRRLPRASRCIDYGTNVVAGVTPGPRRPDLRRRRAGLRHGREAVAAHGRQRHVHLRAAALRGRRDPRGHRRRDPRSSSPSPRASRSSTWSRCGACSTAQASRAPHRPELPRRHHARRSARSASCPGYIHKPGRVGVVSRCGTLTYEAVGQLTALGIGQSTCVGIGGDPVNGTDFVDVLAPVQRRSRHRRRDHDRRDRRQRRGAGRRVHQEAASTKPVAAFIAGATAPPGKPHGPRGRDHLGRQGHGEGQDGRPRERRRQGRPDPERHGHDTKVTALVSPALPSGGPRACASARICRAEGLNRRARGRVRHARRNSRFALAPARPVG